MLRYPVQLCGSLFVGSKGSMTVFFFTSPVTPDILYIIYMIVTRLFSCRQLITHFTRVVLHSAFSLTRRLSLISHGSGGLILSTLPRFSYNRGGLISLPLNRGYSCLTLQRSGSFLDLRWLSIVSPELVLPFLSKFTGDNSTESSNITYSKDFIE